MLSGLALAYIVYAVTSGVVLGAMDNNWIGIFTPKC